MTAIRHVSQLPKLIICCSTGVFQMNGDQIIVFKYCLDIQFNQAAFSM